jgi:hypothetical protein
MIASVAGLDTSARPTAMSVIEMITRPQYAELTPTVAATTKPALMDARPLATTTLVPARFMAPIATGDIRPMTTANGMVATPARRVS